MLIPDCVERNARLYPNKSAIIIPGDRTCTFLELQERVYRLANALSRLGVKKGDRVAILAENCFEYPEMYLAIGKIGGVVTPLNFRFAAPEIEHLINDSAPKVIILQQRYASLIESLRPGLHSIEHYISMGHSSDMMEYNELLASSEPKMLNVEIGGDDLFCLIHTGGTTGTPKLTMLTHRNLVSCALVWIIETGTKYNETFMVISPLFHTGAAWPLFFNFMLGNTFVALEKFDVGQILQGIEKYRVTGTLWMSQLISMIINHPDVAEKKADLSSLRTVIAGASVMPEPDLRRLIQLFPRIRVTNHGGQTECGIFTGIRLEEHLNTSPEKLLSAGKVAVNMEIKVVDEEDNELAARQVGELCVRGDGVMKGYWNKPEESAWSLRGGWQHTGDVCWIDEDGYLYYVDRKKDMIKTGGENVYSKEVEDVLYSHPAVEGAVVIGVPDEKWGEAVRALIIPKKGQKVTPEELIAHCRKHIAGYKCPKAIEFRDDFPRTSLGKIDKKKMREPYWKALNRTI